MFYNIKNTKRLFIGISLSEEVLMSFRSFISKQADIKGIRWIPAGNLHITTCFIGDVITDQIKNIIQITENVITQYDPFPLAFENFCVRPKKRPYMVWARFADNENFCALSADIHEAVGADINKKKPSVPHVTLARFKNPVLSKNIDLAHKGNVSDLQVKEAVLWESVLKPTGAEYLHVKTFLLQ